MNSLSTKTPRRRAVLLMTIVCLSALIGCDKDSKAPAYTVTFSVGQGGTVIPQQKVERGKQATQPANPTRTGFSFGGWFIDEGGNTSFLFTSAITRDITLYAKWEAQGGTGTPVEPGQDVTITFDVGQGTPTIASVSAKSGGTIAQPQTIPTRDGFVFDGWFSAATGGQRFDFVITPINGNITLYAQWKERVAGELVVNFDTDGGTALNPTTVKSGSSIPNAPQVTRDGFTLTGWYTEKTGGTKFNFGSTPVNSSITLYARWTASAANQFTVTFDTDGGSSINSLAVQSGSSIVEPAVNKPGFTLAGWYTEKTGGTKFNFTYEKITSNTTLYARWTQVAAGKFTVSFDVDGGTPEAGGQPIGAQTVDGNQYATKPTTKLYKAGYVFGDWFEDAERKIPFIFERHPITANMLVYARWIPNEYTITFNANNGNPTPPSTQVAHGTLAKKPTDPSRNNFTFSGWTYRDENGVDQVFNFETMTVTQPYMLTARWENRTLKGIIAAGRIPTNLNSYSRQAQDVLRAFDPGAVVIARYVSVSGGSQSAHDGSSWDRAYNVSEVKEKLRSDATTATNDKVILFLFAGGEYNANTMGTLALANNVAIVGGWNVSGNDAQPNAAVTKIINGNCFNNSGVNRKAVLYGVWIQNAYDYGMINDNASPTVSNVTFSGCKRAIYEINTSSVYTNVTFSDNGNDEGAGAYIKGVNAHPIFINCTFASNKAENGGAVFINMDAGTLNYAPVFINCIFWDNTATGVGNTICIQNYGEGFEGVSVFKSILQGGTGKLPVDNGLSDPANFSESKEGGIFSLYNSSARMRVRYAGIETGNPQLNSLSANTATFLPLREIQTGSAAADRGYYVAYSQGRYYVGESATEFFYLSDEEFTKLKGLRNLATISLPAGALLVTGHDARGYKDPGAPDLGAYAFNGEAPPKEQ